MSFWNRTRSGKLTPSRFVESNVVGFSITFVSFQRRLVRFNLGSNSRSVDKDELNSRRETYWSSIISTKFYKTSHSFNNSQGVKSPSEFQFRKFNYLGITSVVTLDAVRICWYAIRVYTCVWWIHNHIFSKVDLFKIFVTNYWPNILRWRSTI